MNVLLSSAGRRVSLIRAFMEALENAGLAGAVYVADASPTAPAMHCVAQSWQVPRCTDADFGTTMLALARRHSIALIVPTIDTELPVYAALRSQFADNGIAVAVSGGDTIRICGDKIATHGWLQSKGFPTVRQSDPQKILSAPASWRFPLIAKPRLGSASIGVQRVDSPDQLRMLADTDFIVQEIAEGVEYTVNVFVNRDGRAICAVPHRRIEVRSGEVAKAVTVRNETLMRLSREIAEALPDAYGPLNIQCFLSHTGQVRVIEINPRFGGGYPLAHRAGAHFTDWLIAGLLERPLPGHFDAWQDDLAMLRYDEAIFLEGSRIRSAA